MIRKRAIKRMLLTLMWVSVGAGMFVIIAAAMRVQKETVCAGYNINIHGAQEGVLFTSKEQVAKLLKEATGHEVKGMKKSSFNLPRIEDLLEQSSWVYNAELYFDNKDILHVTVTERKPLARVFASNGSSFYIDEAGKHIPLSDKISLDVPVFTGYPDKKIMNAVDSSLLENMIAAASFINSDSFWVSQVSQIDILPCGKDCWNMEMVPVVGNHRVGLGDGSDVASKFHRLYLFYDQVLKRTGFDKYKRLDVQYNGQVVGIKGDYTKTDSLQLRKNIEDLLQQSRKANDVIEVAQVIPGLAATADTSAAAAQLFANPMSDGEEPVVTEKPEIAVAAVPEKPKETPKPVVKQEVKKPEVKKEVEKKAEPKKTSKPVASKAKEEDKKADKKKAETKKPAAKKLVEKKTEKKADKKPEVKKAAASKATTKPVAKPAAKKETDKKKTTTKKNTN